MQAWLAMANGVIEKSGFPAGLDRDGLIQAFMAHNDAAKDAIPAKRLLLFEVKGGWDPLCTFLGVRAPTEAFPRTNHREEFWDRVEGKI